MPEKQEKGVELKSVDLNIAVTLTREGKIESCCNYEISGRSGNLLMVLPPMTHIQDMVR